MNKVNFSDLFNQIYEKHGKELKDLHTNVIIKKIIIMIVMIAVEFMIFSSLYESVSETENSPIFKMILMMIVLILGFVLSNLVTKNYAKEFKNKAIRILVEDQNETYKYSPKKGLTSIEYNRSRFDTSWDHFYSEDYVSGILGKNVKFRMSQVHTEEEQQTTDSDGNTTTHNVTTFFGLYGIIELPVHAKGEIMIVGNSVFRKFNASRVEMESSEFEKNYDVLAEDRLWAMQVINANVIEEFVKMRNFFKKTIQVKVERNKIYFRLYCGDIFEPPKFKSSLDFDILHKYFRIIDIPNILYQSMIENMIMDSNNKELKMNHIVEKMSDEQRKQYEEAKQKKEEETYFSTKK